MIKERKHRSLKSDNRLSQSMNPVESTQKIRILPIIGSKNNSNTVSHKFKKWGHKLFIKSKVKIIKILIGNIKEDKRTMRINIIRNTSQCIPSELLTKKRKGRKIYIDYEKEIKKIFFRIFFVRLKRKLSYLTKCECKLCKRIKTEIRKIVLIQRKFRGFILRKKRKEDLIFIKKHLKTMKRVKLYEQKKKEMNIKKKAVRVIEKYWMKVLERRKDKFYEESLQKVPEECRDLYRKMIRLKRDTRNLKREMNEYKYEGNKNEFKNIFQKYKLNSSKNNPSEIERDIRIEKEINRNMNKKK